MKRVLAMLLACAMLLAFAACGSTTTETAETADTSAASGAATNAAQTEQTEGAGTLTAAVPEIEQSEEAAAYDGEVKTITITIRYDSTGNATNAFLGDREMQVIYGFQLLEAQDPSVHFEIQMMDKLEFNDLLLQHQAGVDADIFIDYENVIGECVEAGMIQSTDWYFEDATVQDTMFPGLQEKCSYKGSTYMVPLDHALNMVYVNKDYAKAIGWTDEDIATLSDRIISGEYTYDDLMADGKKAVDMGVCHSGLIIDGLDKASLWTMYSAYGITPYDSETDTFNYTESQWLPFLQDFEQEVKDEVIPAEITSYADTYMEFFNGGSLFYTDVSAWGHFRDNCGMSNDEYYQYFDEHFEMVLFPGNTELGGSACVATKIRGAFISSTVDAEKLEYIKKALTLSITDEEFQNNLRHNGHVIPYTTAYTDTTEVASDEYVNEAKFAVEYSTVRPLNSNWEDIYNQAVRTALQGVLNETLTAEEANEQIKNELSFNLEGVIIQ